jgi:cell wall-associated NlpC family hydrolase
MNRMLVFAIAATLAIALLPQGSLTVEAAEKGKAGQKAKGSPPTAHVAISVGDGRTIESKKSATKTIKSRAKSSKCADGFDCSELMQWATSQTGANKGAAKRAKSR